VCACVCVGCLPCFDSLPWAAQVPLFSIQREAVNQNPVSIRSHRRFRRNFKIFVVIRPLYYLFFFKGLFSKGPTVALARKFMEKDENPFQSRSGFVSGFVRFALPLEFDHFQLISSKIDSLLINLMWWMLIEWSQLITDADYQSSNKFLSQMVDWFSSITKLVSNDRNSWPVMKIF